MVQDRDIVSIIGEWEVICILSNGAMTVGDHNPQNEARIFKFDTLLTLIK